MHTNQHTLKGLNTLTITIKDADDTIQQIKYQFFKLSSAPNYEFDVSEPGVGNLPDDFYFHRNLPFRAVDNADQRNDSMSCVEKLRVSRRKEYHFLIYLQVGWWYRLEDNCALVLLTGKFDRNNALCHSRMPYPICDGVYWSDWMGFRTIKHVTMELSKY